MNSVNLWIDQYNLFMLNNRKKNGVGGGVGNEQSCGSVGQ